MNKVKKVVVVGGGTAGWITAASLATLLGKNFELCLVESEQIGTVGVGEATIPTLFTLHQLLKINEQDFLTASLTLHKDLDFTIKLMLFLFLLFYFLPDL